MLSIPISADELAHIFAAGAEASSGNLLIDIGLECVGQGNIHRAHVPTVAPMAKIGKAGRSYRPDFQSASLLGVFGPVRTTVTVRLFQRPGSVIFRIPPWLGGQRLAADRARRDG